MPTPKSNNPFAVLAALPTSDMRSPAMDSQRAKRHNTKWKNGQRPAAGKQCSHILSAHLDSCSTCATRPMVAHNTWKTVSDSAKARNSRIGQATSKKYIRGDIVEGDMSDMDEESDNNSVEHTDSASLPMDIPAKATDETEIMYSYDNKSGPSAGQDILSNAVMKAVTKFENKQTEKLVRTEYDLVNPQEAADEHIFAADDEDDFEMIEEADYIK